jgi:predicted Fe-Mo cluster-binding NifX family protein
MYVVEDCSIKEMIEKEGPEHEPGVIPRWLKSEGVDVVITGGVGQKAIRLFESLGIQTVVGVSPRETDEVVQEYLAGSLTSDSNLCDH